MLNNNLDYEKSKSIQHFERVAFIDYGLSQAFLDEMHSPRTFKTHLLRKLLPDNIENKAKVIYIARNLKDVVISGHEFLKTMAFINVQSKLDQRIEAILLGKDIPYGLKTLNKKSILKLRSFFYSIFY